MAQSVLEAQQLVGQNRNGVHGQAGGAPLVPWRVFNLVPHRLGGYTPYGRRVRLQNDAVNVTIPNIVRLIGHDETGIASMATTITGTGELRLFRGEATITQDYPDYTDPGRAVHIDTAGAYINRNAYLVLDRESRKIEPLNVGVSAEVSLASPTTVTVIDGTPLFIDVAYGNGKFIAITVLGDVYHSLDSTGSTWELWSSVASTDCYSVAYGNGVWLISTLVGKIWKSTDAGENWASYDVFGYDWESYALTYVDENVWYLGSRGDSFGPDFAGVMRSTDGGETWAVVNNLQFEFGGNSELGTVGKVSVNTDFEYAIAPVAESVSIPALNALPVFTSLDTGLTWAAGAGGSRTSTKGMMWSVAGPYRFYMFSGETGVVQQCEDFRESEGSRPHATWGISAITLAGSPLRGGWDDFGENLYVVGTKTAGGPGIWRSGDDASSLGAVSMIEDAMSEAGATVANAVAFDGAGNAVFVGDGGVIVSAPTLEGLEPGTYNIYTVAYFNTKAGRFAFALNRNSLVINEEDGAGINVQAATKGEILDPVRNPWLGLIDAGEATDIVDSLRLDAYIQYLPERGDSTTEETETTYTLATAETTIRYAFTVPFPEGASGLDSVGRRIGELPIGRQIVSRGAPTTVAFEPSLIAADGTTSAYALSRTALHNGRIWGLAAQDEDSWEEADGISLEIANQFNRFVLTYTEIGWANLVSDQSFIPIQPTQSANFTGMLSTPSGLMVMFDNEVFLVTGDPAFGNVAVELYLDMAGADPSSPPAKIGGLPFSIWDGRVWALQAGQAQDISRDQWLPDDRFVRIVPEPESRSILCLTASGQVLRFLVDEGFWLTDPVNRTDFAISELLPNCVCATGDYTRFVTSLGAVWVTRRDGTPDTPHLVYRDMDFGYPERRTPLYVVKATLEGDVATWEESGGGGIEIM